MIWRQSTYKDWQTCQYSFYLKHIKSAPSRRIAVAEYGTMAHRYNECQLFGDMTIFDEEYPSISARERAELDRMWQSAYRFMRAKCSGAIMPETKLKLSESGYPIVLVGEWMNGTIDAYGVNGGRAVLFDYKYGTSGWCFELQAKWYANLLAHSSDECDDFDFYFLHPRLADNSEYGFKTDMFKFTRAELRQWFETLRMELFGIEAFIALSDEINYTDCNDDKQCRRCFVNENCTRRKDALIK